LSELREGELRVTEIPRKYLDPKVMRDQPRERSSYSPASTPDREMLPAERPDGELNRAANGEKRKDAESGDSGKSTEVTNCRKEPIKAPDVGCDTSDKESRNAPPRDGERHIEKWQ
jgi:hypothetical protein